MCFHIGIKKIKSSLLQTTRFFSVKQRDRAFVSRFTGIGLDKGIPIGSGLRWYHNLC